MDHDVKHFGPSSWSAERLRAVTKSYATLEPKTRLKILTSFLHLQLRTYSELENELREFLQIARDDSDPWIRSISAIMSTLPERGCLNDKALPDSNSSEAFKKLTSLCELTHQLAT